MRETLTIRLPENLSEALAEEARQSGVPKGEIVRQAIAARLQQSGTRSVLARHLGIMSGPSDLSTNKAYRRVWNRKRR